MAKESTQRMTPTEQKSALFAAINQCDTMILQADIEHANERVDPAQYVRKMTQHKNRRTALVKHREQLENLYVSLYNEKP